MEVNAVFEGGGVRAIAFVGAVDETEKRGITFHQVAGTSSGSLVASFIAAGYRAEEMKRMIIETPFQSFLRRSWVFQTKYVGPMVRLFIKKGLYSGEALEQWVHQKLLEKGIHTFGDLEKNKLRIIASDITNGKLLLLPDDIAQFGIDPMKFPISKAVRMSTSIPYFFDPVMIRRSLQSMRKDQQESFRKQFVYVVDGGLLSNFPLWIFDKENKRDMPMMMRLPTLGYRLVGKNKPSPHRIDGPISMFQALASTMMGAHDERFIEEHNFFRTIAIPTLGVTTTQFDIKKQTGLKLYDSGMKSAKQFFRNWTKEQYMQQFEEYVIRHDRKGQ